MTVWTTIETPLGAMALAAEAGRVIGAWFDGRRQPAPGWTSGAGAPVLAVAAEQLTEYFSGMRRSFELSLAPAGTPFEREVWRRIGEIGFGETTTYGALAATLRRPSVARAVGAATARNPLAVFVPCHRVVGRNGALTGYAGGLERKRALLELERAAVLSRR